MLHTLLAAGLSMLSAGWQLTSISVHGADRFADESVLRAAGLRKGMQAGKPELDGACQKLVQSGLFQHCGYKWKPVSAAGVAVEMTLREVPADFTAKFAIPGVEEAKVWEWLDKNEPLVLHDLPGSEDVLRFYAAAVTRALRALGEPAEITYLITEERQIVFRPASLNTIVDVRFRGSVLFSDKQLRDALMPVALQGPFLDAEFRKLLDLNIRPLYEEKGRLGISFPEVTTEKAEGGVIVTTTVREGPVYVLKSVEFSEEVPAAARPAVGTIANWRAVQDAVTHVERLLREHGHPGVVCEATRKLDDAAGHVHVHVKVRRGER